MFNTITLEQAEIVKLRLWNGEDIAVIAKDFKVKASSIYNIRAGWKWDNAKWPNGATGAMPRARVKVVAMAAKRARRIFTSQILKEIDANS